MKRWHIIWFKPHESPEKVKTVWASPMAQWKRIPPANTGDTKGMGSLPGLGRSPGVGNGNPLHYSCLENSMETWTWQDIVHGVSKCQTWLSNWARAHTHTHTHTHIHRGRIKISSCQGLQRGKDKLAEYIGFSREWNYSIWYYNDGWMDATMHLSTLNAHQEWVNPKVNYGLWVMTLCPLLVDQ